MGKYIYVVAAWGEATEGERKVDIAAVVVETFSVTYYFPVLLVAGLLTGLVIGIVAEMMLKRLVNIQF